MIQSTIRWRSDQSLPVNFWNPWSNKSEWWLQEGDNPWNLLFSSRIVARSNSSAESKTRKSTSSCVHYISLFILVTLGIMWPSFLWRNESGMSITWLNLQFKTVKYRNLYTYNPVSKLKLKTMITTKQFKKGTKIQSKTIWKSNIVDSCLSWISAWSWVLPLRILVYTSPHHQIISVGKFLETNIFALFFNKVVQVYLCLHPWTQIKILYKTY